MDFYFNAIRCVLELIFAAIVGVVVLVAFALIGNFARHVISLGANLIDNFFDDINEKLRDGRR